ncbi:hypothetical protein JZ751_003831 [Albula glossodonta]|uniref:Uncharacterized protein n=1 Tax=Albula glossodonta TaxID=121402 RepID=A0A8T2P5I1_9TELE|nr:hypothetical protein JZ751_003831 [Albula glossodonta]
MEVTPERKLLDSVRLGIGERSSVCSFRPSPRCCTFSMKSRNSVLKAFMRALIVSSTWGSVLPSAESPLASPSRHSPPITSTFPSWIRLSVSVMRRSTIFPSRSASRFMLANDSISSLFCRASSAIESPPTSEGFSLPNPDVFSKPFPPGLRADRLLTVTLSLATITLRITVPPRAGRTEAQVGCQVVALHVGDEDSVLVLEFHHFPTQLVDLQAGGFQLLLQHPPGAQAAPAAISVPTPTARSGHPIIASPPTLLARAELEAELGLLLDELQVAPQLSSRLQPITIRGGRDTREGLPPQAVLLILAADVLVLRPQAPVLHFKLHNLPPQDVGLLFHQLQPQFKLRFPGAGWASAVTGGRGTIHITIHGLVLLQLLFKLILLSAQLGHLLAHQSGLLLGKLQLAPEKVGKLLETWLRFIKKVKQL